MREAALTGRTGVIADGRNPRHGLARPPAELVAALVALTCYVNVLPNDFCDDGIPIVEQNPLVQDPDQWLAIWTTDYWHMAWDATPNRDLLYRPLAITSFRVVQSLFGEAPWPQHAFNMLLHALVTIGVVRLTRLIVPNSPAPWLAGLFFAALPIHNEVIANAVGRADLLAALGTIGALLAYHHVGWASPTTVGRVGLQTHLLWRLTLAISVFSALSAKENGVAVLALLPLWSVIARKRPSWSTVFAVIFPAVLYFVLRYQALDGHLFQKPALTKTVNMLVDAPGWQRALGALQLWGMYWLKTLWPDTLNVNYSINALRPATSLVHAHVLIGLTVLLILVLVTLQAWKRGSRDIVFIVCGVVVAYAPTANLLVLIQVSFAERIWYLPSAFVCVLAGAAFRSDLARPATWLVIALLVGGMAMRNLVRNTEWRDNLTLYAAAYRDAPHAVGALRLYGNELVSVGEYVAGIELLQKAIEIDLGFTDAQRSLGQAYLLSENYADAVRHLQIADMQIPGHPPTQAALRAAREALGRSNVEALAALRAQADAEPGDVTPEIMLLSALRAAGLLDQALNRLENGAARFAGNADWQYQRGVTLVTANRLDEAIAAYERSAELNPAVPSRLIEQAMLRLERRMDNDLDRAGLLTAEALLQSPGLPEALVCRAELFALRGDFAAAAQDYQQAIKSLDPSDPRRRFWQQRAQTLGGG